MGILFNIGNFSHSQKNFWFQQQHRKPKLSREIFPAFKIFLKGRLKKEKQIYKLNFSMNFILLVIKKNWLRCAKSITEVVGTFLSNALINHFNKIFHRQVKSQNFPQAKNFYP